MKTKLKKMFHKTSFLIQSNLREGSRQIKKGVDALQNEGKIFLLAPFGAGKTTQVAHFSLEYPEYSVKYRSFLKIHSLEFAFLHMVPFLTRAFLLSFLILGAIGLIRLVPQIGPFPLWLVAAAFFIKSFGNLLYLVHEIFTSLFRRKPQIVILDDLEKSGLSLSDQIVFLSNLWKRNNIYLIPLGYAPESKEGPLKQIAFVVKLEGALIELPIDVAAHFQMIQKVDPDFPFVLLERERLEKKGWLSLFTYRELLVLHQQVILRVQADRESSKRKKQFSYIEISLNHLMGKLGLAQQALKFSQEKGEIEGFSEVDLSEQQRYYLYSFFDSISPDVSLKRPSSGESQSEWKAFFSQKESQPISGGKER